VKVPIFYIFSSLYNQLVIFDVIVFPLAASCYFMTKMHDQTIPYLNCNMPEQTKSVNCTPLKRTSVFCIEIVNPELIHQKRSKTSAFIG